MYFRSFVVAALIVAAGCSNSEPAAPVTPDRPLFLAIPDDGNGNKIITPFEFFLPAWVTCANGETLDLRLVGWLQDRPGEFPPNHGLVSLYYEFTYSNTAGETYLFRQAGNALFYFDDNGDLLMESNGRFFDGIGRLVMNLTTGEIISNKGNPTLFDDTACARLT